MKIKEEELKELEDEIKELKDRIKRIRFHADGWMEGAIAEYCCRKILEIVKEGEE